MRFTPTFIEGLVVIDIEPVEDHRGFFARTFADDQYETHGLDAKIVQCSISYNARQGTLRGMHLQRDPWSETKVVRCTRGAIFDVAVDLRSGSPTFKRWYAAELTETNRRMLYVPRGVAHGFQCLQDDTEVFYQMSQRYRPDAAAGVRWNDPAFGIDWPLAPPILSERDATYPDFAG